MLVATNAWLIYSYYQTPDMINNIIVLFYIQSVLIGLVNVAELYSFDNYVNKEFVQHLEDKKTKGCFSKKDGCFALFFAGHYGGFHFVYLFFLAGIIDFHKLDIPFIKTTCLVLIGNAVINFVHDKIRNRDEAVNLGVMFFMPYARVVPMHLMILLPEFFPVSRSILFLLLKAGADVIMFIVQRRMMFAPAKNSTPGINQQDPFME